MPVDQSSAFSALMRTYAGVSDEWHLVLGNAFGHRAFHLGAGLGQPVVVIAPPLFQPRLVPVGPVADPMGRDGIEQVVTQLWMCWRPTLVDRRGYPTTKEAFIEYTRRKLIQI
jgi:hypothetical protein